MGTQIDADIAKLLSRHQGNSTALRQFLENLYRFANDQPSVQQQASQSGRSNINAPRSPQSQQSLQSQETNAPAPPRSPQTRVMKPEKFSAPSIIGIWEEKYDSPSQSISTFTFQQEGANYIGSTMLGSKRLALRDISIIGDQITAKASTTIPAGAINLSYKLTLSGDRLVGQGTYEFNGQKSVFSLNLKRISSNPNGR